jgi:hypothetical protein
MGVREGCKIYTGSDKTSLHPVIGGLRYTDTIDDQTRSRGYK